MGQSMGCLLAGDVSVISICLSIYLSIYAYMYVYVYVYVHICVCICTFTYMFVSVYTHTHTHTHTHTMSTDDRRQHPLVLDRQLHCHPRVSHGHRGAHHAPYPPQGTRVYHHRVHVCACTINACMYALVYAYTRMPSWRSSSSASSARNTCTR